MSSILQSLEMPWIVEAIEATLTEEVAWFGRVMPFAELHKTPELFWLYSGQAGTNAVLATHLKRNDHDYAQAKIDEMIAYYDARDITFGWTVGPSTRPAHLAAILETRGFQHIFSTTGMAADLRAINEDVPVHTALAITEIDDLYMLQVLGSIEVQGFETSWETAQLYVETYARAGFGHGQPWHHYLGWLHGMPVASASLLYHAGVAGIFGVATLPEARRQGIAATMMLHVLRQARERGYTIAILSPTEMSEALYRRMGFQAYCALQHYEWTPGE